MFKKRDVTDNGYTKVTNSHLKLIDKLAAKIEYKFEFVLWDCYLDQKQFLRIIHSLAHVRKIRFLNVEFDFGTFKYLNKYARFQICTLYF